jgi:methionine synthase II (cobalamin-independent)
MTLAWSAAAATSIGSMPGTSALEATRVVVGELPTFVHVVELPARGPGADMIGRTGGMLAQVSAGLGLETTPDGWRFTAGIGREMRRAISFLGEDLDAIEDVAADYSGPVKCQIVGPWTMAASIELQTGERALRDPAAAWDMAQAIGEAVRTQVADLRRRMPRASAIVVQFDEPTLPAVLEGRIGTASGLSSYRAVDPQVAERLLRHVLTSATDAGATAGVHCCADDAPVDLFRTSGAAFVSVDITRMDDAQEDAIGQALDAGMGILVGTIPSTGAGRIGDTEASAPLRAMLHRLGLEDAHWLDQVAVTPTCGLAAASPDWTRAALAACRGVGRVIRNDERDGGSDAG